jgi:hypothetical protein
MPTISHSRLSKYAEAIDGARETLKDNPLFKRYDYKNIVLYTVIKRILNETNLKTVLQFYPEVKKNTVMLDCIKGRLWSSWHKTVLDLFSDEELVNDKFNVLSNYYIGVDYDSDSESDSYDEGDSNEGVIAYLQSRGLLEKALIKIDFSKQYATVMNIMLKAKLDQTLTDADGNTVLHCYTRFRPLRFNSDMKNFTLHSRPNNFGKTPMDYMETHINNSALYNDMNLPKYYRAYSALRTAYKKNGHTL